VLPLCALTKEAQHGELLLIKATHVALPSFRMLGNACSATLGEPTMRIRSAGVLRSAGLTIRLLGVAFGLLLTTHMETALTEEGKAALVIGNSAYKNSPALANPRADATDVAIALGKLGYSVTKGFDLDKSEMDDLIRGFARNLANAEVGVFFYAGHGLQVNGRNYLVPIDAKLEDGSSLDFELVKLEAIQRQMERATKTNIIFLDACRDNPLARNLARSMGTRSNAIGRGLAPAESGVGTMISFSTQPGNVALDGLGRNSPFAGALVKQLLSSNDNISDMLIAVRRDVMKATSNRQVPWEHSALTASFYFSPSVGHRAGKTAGDMSPAQQAELILWNSVKDSQNPSVIRSYIDTYPKGLFVPVAEVIIADLEDPERLKKSVDVSSFNGRWNVIRIGQNCPANRYWFEIEILDGRISGNVPTGGKISGRVTKRGELQFRHPGHAGGLVLYSANLKGRSGAGTFEVANGRCKGTIAMNRL
jgi:hypothetical protein